ncbi:MAG: beta-eliminating lyase-related protein, partial [Janthinobacterium lividum]
AAALGTDVATLTRGFDTVNFCLSKGLCAPVGSLLVGSAESIRRARPLRKAMGGGMRQAGILAAAGLIALEQMPARLHEDHANAKLLAASLSKVEGLHIDPDAVETNIVILTTDMDAAALVAGIKSGGVVASAIGPHSVRLVTHRDVDTADCMRAAEVVAGVAAGMVAGA